MADAQLVKVSEEIKGNLAIMQEEFAKALVGTSLARQEAKFVKVAQTAIANLPALVNCDRTSLYMAFTECAQDGLLPDKKEACIIPYNGKAKYMPMVAGICKKARNSGEISVIDATVVYENDFYESWTDEKGPHFKYVRTRNNRGKPITTFAYAIRKDGGVFFEEIDEEQMAAIEKKSQAAGDSPWKGPFKDEMRRKSGLHRLGKYRLPNSSDLDSIFRRDEEFYDENDEGDEEPAATPKSPTRLGKIIEVTAEEIPEPTRKPVAPAPARPAQAPAPARPAPSKPAALTVKGKIAAGGLKVVDSKDPANAWRRFAMKIGEVWYGTYDAKVGDRFAPAADAGGEVKITYKIRKEGEAPNEKTFYDVTSIEFDEGEGEGEGTPVAPSQVPL